ncbi:unnamed protein product, partial [Meganyctiphanes norvegica]
RQAVLFPDEIPPVGPTIQKKPPTNSAQPPGPPGALPPGPPAQPARDPIDLPDSLDQLSDNDLQILNGITTIDDFIATFGLEVQENNPSSSSRSNLSNNRRIGPGG